MKSLLNLKMEEKALSEELHQIDPNCRYYAILKNQLIKIKKGISEWGTKTDQIYQII